MERGRFAPSPSGPLHLGSARTALAAYLAARDAGGAFVLRVEDLDAPRVVPGAAQGQMDDLRWLGIRWDEGPDVGGPSAPYVQSARGGLYAAALELLRVRGVAYPCECSRRDVEQAAQAPHGAEPVYPGTCRGRDPDEVLRAAAARGRGVSWRVRVPPGAVRVDDRVAGATVQDVAREVGDFVVQRADGVPAYQLAVVVDDLAMGVTEVVRGDDLLASAARQSLLCELLGARPPRYAHVPLVVGDDGARLAKRHGAIALRTLRERGAAAERVVGALLTSLGTAPALADARFDPGRVPRGTVSLAELRRALPEIG